MSIAKYGATIGEFTRRFREEAGLTQSELAESMGIHKQYVSNVERGSHINPVAFCAKLRPHVDTKRLKYLDDLLDESLHESLTQRIENASLGIKPGRNTKRGSNAKSSRNSSKKAH